jgi:hypothetical protein
MRMISILLLSVAIPSVLHAAPTQPELGARTKKTITVKGLRFKDLNANGRLDDYEDWRLPAQKRAADLVARMTLAEKAGMMLIATNNPDCNGSVSQRGRDLIDTQKKTRFILHTKANSVAPDCTVKLIGFALRVEYPQPPVRMARFSNAVQDRLEAGRLGIPGLSKDNARNHVEVNGGAVSVLIKCTVSETKWTGPASTGRWTSTATKPSPPTSSPASKASRTGPRIRASALPNSGASWRPTAMIFRTSSATPRPRRARPTSPCPPTNSPTASRIWAA